MRPQQNRRVRGRNNNNNNNNNNRRGPNPLSRNYESSGPDVKIRGNAQQIADKYISLARDAQGAGDRVMSENYLQHAEHYLRIILAAAGQMQSVRCDENRDENRDENNEQECSEINAEGEKKGKDTANCDTEVLQIPLQKNNNSQHVKSQNGQVHEDACGMNVLFDEEIDPKQCDGVEEKIEPVKKTRRPSRRRAVRAQEEETLELSHFKPSREISETSQKGDMPLVKVASLPVGDKEVQRKRRRRQGATPSSAEETV
ncbi:hypothetical protein HNQ69_001479 [Bartonella callosciuri]|uniref:DUF4167 domain-containing protein n=1 Tax=Bartonella callosciuri TaxID=686223 RepID=A0A840NTF8_9HYPH|nr:DUF4167 domain-containing protein [Bartonella callosciuri]MBB5074341.1 hypothetical protein [Bartonella callosciuri]